MSQDDPVVVRVSRHFDASPERVFDAWLDPATAGRWLFATPDGQMQRVEVDARVGGSFVIAEQRPGGLAQHFGRYLEIDRPRRLVFVFSVDANVQHGDRVTVEIAPAGNGCVLTLTHVMASEFADFAKRTESGWGMVLASLARNLGAA